MSKLPFLYHVVDGHKYPTIFSEDGIRSALRYVPKPDDVFIATYPKCGTTWLQQIVYLIFSGGVPPIDYHQLSERCPFLELQGDRAVANIRRPGAFKTHLRFEVVPYSPHAKYIWVARNPKDCCVSYYHHSLGLYRDIGGSFTFDDFFECFLQGEVQYGDYFEHFLGWCSHRNDRNVWSSTYEQMKDDPEKNVLGIARFLGDVYYRNLCRDPQFLRHVLEFSSVAYMKDTINESMKDYIARESRAELASKANAFQHYSIVRQGGVADWKRHLDDEQSARITRMADEKLKGTEIYDFWKAKGYI